MKSVLFLNSIMLTEAVGLMAGFIAISAAIYLQMIMVNPCPAKYVLSFFLFGLIMMVANSSLIISDGVVIMTLQILTYTLVIIGELYVANEIKKKVSGRSSVESLDTGFAKYL